MQQDIINDMVVLGRYYDYEDKFKNAFSRADVDEMERLIKFYAEEECPEPLDYFEWYLVSNIRKIKNDVLIVVFPLKHGLDISNMSKTDIRTARDSHKILKYIKSLSNLPRFEIVAEEAERFLEEYKDGFEMLEQD